MENQPNTRRHSQIDREPPTYKETVITGASKNAVLYNVVSNLFWALLDLLISIWRFGFGRQKPSTTVSGNQAVSGNTRDQNGSFPVGKTPQKHARKKGKANSSNSSTNVKSSPSQTQITNQKPSTTVSGNQAVSGNTRDQNGSFPVGNTPQKHARKKVTANCSNSSTNAKSSPPSQTQITKDGKPRDVQKPSITVSDNQVSRNTGDDNGRFSVGNARKKDKASSSNSSTSARLSRPSQTQISKDDKPEDDRKPCIVVSGNQINDNKGHGNGIFSVGNT